MAAPIASTGAATVADAQRFLTPDVRTRLPAAVLALPLGDGTVASALNDSIRFRVEGTGPFSQRQIVPDSPLTASFAQSAAGAELVARFRVALGTIDGFEDRAAVHEIFLPRDADAVVAHMLLGLVREQGTDFSSLADPKDAAELVPQFGAMRTFQTDNWREGFSGETLNGVTTLRPDTARSVLAAVGAYHPMVGERSRKATNADFDVVTTLVHEFQHDVTPWDTDSTQPSAWMEEGLAKALSEPAPIHDAVARAIGFSNGQYADRIAHAPSFRLGWKPWFAPEPDPTQAQAGVAIRHGVYRDGYARITDLVQLTGNGFGPGSIGATRHLLQDAPSDQLPGRFADALVARWGVDPSRRDELASRIAGLISDPRGLPGIVADFVLHAR